MLEDILGWIFEALKSIAKIGLAIYQTSKVAHFLIEHAFAIADQVDMFAQGDLSSAHSKRDPMILSCRSVCRPTSARRSLRALFAMMISVVLFAATEQTSLAQSAGYCLAQCNAHCYGNSAPSCAAGCTSRCMASGRNTAQPSSAPLWGAIAAAHPMEEGNGISWDHNSRSAAVSAALDACHKYAQHCDLLLAYSGPNCAAYTNATDATHTKNFGTYAHIARTSTEAVQGSLQMCLIDYPEDQCETHPEMAKCNGQ
jgi:hypothetical protein